MVYLKRNNDIIPFYKIITVLDKKTQDIITPHILGGLKYREIGMIMDLAESSVSKRFWRDMKTLHK